MGHKILLLARNIAKQLTEKAEAARLNMDAEPVVSEIGVYRPALTGVDMKLYNSPCSIHVRLQERKMKLEKQQKESQA